MQSLDKRLTIHRSAHCGLYHDWSAFYQRYLYDNQRDLLRGAIENKTVGDFGILRVSITSNARLYN